MGPTIRKSLWDNRFETGSFLAKMRSFWDPQSGNPYGIIDLELVYFWSKTAKTGSLRQNIGKHMHDPRAVAQAELSPNLLATNKQTTTFSLQANGSGASRNKFKN